MPDADTLTPRAGIDWNGPKRQHCPACGRGPSDHRTCGVTVESIGEGVAHCFRCDRSWFEKERATVAPRRLVCVSQTPARHAEAARRARVIWNEALPVRADHPYLYRKRVAPHGARVDRHGWLVVPMFVDGELVGLQQIAPDGTKLFLKGQRMAGATFTLADCCLDDDLVFVAEGFATAATVHYAMALPVVVAFSAGNLTAAAQAARGMYPKAPIVIAADNDAKPDGGNPGIEAAEAAARAVGALYAAPGKPGDWNDVMLRAGWPAVVECLRVAERAARA